jgi:hypothetical protein
MKTVCRYKIFKQQESGFVLPSILFFINILALVALSVVMLRYL